MGGDFNCKHKWGIKIPPKGEKSGKHGPNSTIGAKIGQDGTRRGEGSNYCLKCGAWKGQLGLEPHPQEFINHLVQGFNILKKKLKKTGSLYLNLGDTYCGSGHGDATPFNLCKESYQLPPGTNPKNNPKNNPKIMNKGWLQPKQLMMMPSRIAIALQENGWILRNFIIWQKPNPMPSSVKDRLNTTWEAIFHFVKNKKYYYDLDAIREEPKWVDDKGKRIGSNTIGQGAKLTKHELATNRLSGSYSDPLHTKPLHPLGKNPGDVLEYNSKYKETEYGQTLQGFTRNQTIEKQRQQSRIDAEKMFPNDEKKQQEYINLVHDHSGHPLGRNPGDVLIIRENYNPNPQVRFALPPQGAAHKNGKNPGDVFDSKYICEKEDIGPAGGEGSFARWKALNPRTTHELGKNPGDTWRITTKPFPEAHFAVYPVEICEKPIKSSVPSEICSKCGFIRERILEKEYTPRHKLPKEHPHYRPETTKEGYKNGKYQEAGLEQGSAKPQNMKYGVALITDRKTIGYTKCSCNTKWKGAICLDPFAGSGTTFVALKKYKPTAKWLGFEINEDYIKIANKRLAQKTLYEIEDGKT